MISTASVFAAVSVLLLSGVMYCSGQVTISINLPNAIAVNESDGSIQVCVQTDGPLSNPTSVDFQSREQTAMFGMDFIDATRTVTFTSSPNQESSCFNIVIMSDNTVERSMETFLVLLLPNSQSSNSGIIVDTQIHTITIIDTDKLNVSFSEPYYNVTEGTPSVSVCSEIVGGLLADDSDDIRFGIDFFDSNSTATSGVDFSANLGELQFVFDDSNQITSCISIGINDDDTIEDAEQFYLSLELRPGLSESVEFVNGTTRVTIRDNDAATVILIPDPNEAIRVPEGNRSMLTPIQLCVALAESNNEEIERDVVVNVATIENTATEGDFELLMTNLTIARGSSEGAMTCINVTIIGDNLLEQDESLTVELTAITADVIMDGSESITITILHDGDLNICPVLEEPQNGALQSNGYNLGSIVTYSCNQNYQLSVNPSTRVCQQDGTWTGEDPRCLALCTSILSILNGQINKNGNVEGSIVTYTCINGYTINGNSSRVCLNTTEWSGEDPTCEVVDCNTLPNPANGMIIYDSGTTFQAQAIYRCNEGFRVVTGSEVRVCGQDGEWTGTAAVCGGGSSSATPITSGGLVLALLMVVTLVTAITSLSN